MLKKFVSAIICGALAVGFISCGNETQATKDTNVNKDTNATKQEQKQQTILFKLADIKNADQNKANELLGQPISHKNAKWKYKDGRQTNDCFTNVYNKDNFEIEIFFIEGKAARITITPKDKIKVADSNKIFKLLDIKECEPDAESRIMKGWQNKFGVYEFNTNFQDGYVTFYYIVTSDKFK